MQPFKMFVSQQYLSLILMLQVAVYWCASSLTNPIAMVLLGLLMVDVLLRNVYYSKLLSGLFFLLACYMFLALFSELHEFPNFNKEALVLLLFGWTYLSSIIAVASFRIYKLSMPNTV